jgi:hypothetical protein
MNLQAWGRSMNLQAWGTVCRLNHPQNIHQTSGYRTINNRKRHRLYSKADFKKKIKSPTNPILMRAIQQTGTTP